MHLSNHTASPAIHRYGTGTIPYTARSALPMYLVLLLPPPLLQVAEAKVGELFRIETIDWTGGQVKDDDSAEDIK